MLCWRRISAIGTPASPCFRISTIWLSVNRDFRMGISLAPESLRSKCLPEGEAYDAARGSSETPALVTGPTRKPSSCHGQQQYAFQHEGVEACANGPNRPK